MRIDIDGLTVRYGQHTALDRVSLSARPGEILGILGPNGSGKSSLVKAVAGIVPATGQIQFDGAGQRGGTLGYMPQDHQSRAALTVLETVLLGRLGQLGFRVKAEDIDMAEHTLCEVGIAHLATRDLSALSGGQRQLVFLAQALAAEPSALLLDEPFSALDIRHQLEVAELLERLTREHQLTTMIVLHDIPLAVRLAHHLALLREGRLIALGESADVATSPAMRAVFQVEFITERLVTGAVEIRHMHLPAGG